MVKTEIAHILHRMCMMVPSQYAFTFELLNWYEALLLECQVALKDFCQALAYKLPYLVVKVSVLHAI